MQTLKGKEQLRMLEPALVDRILEVAPESIRQAFQSIEAAAGRVSLDPFVGGQRGGKQDRRQQARQQQIELLAAASRLLVEWVANADLQAVLEHQTELVVDLVEWANEHGEATGVSFASPEQDPKEVWGRAAKTLLFFTETLAESSVAEALTRVERLVHAERLDAAQARFSSRTH